MREHRLRIARRWRAACTVELAFAALFFFLGVVAAGIVMLVAALFSQYAAWRWEP